MLHVSLGSIGNARIAQFGRKMLTSGTKRFPQQFFDQKEEERIRSKAGRVPRLFKVTPVTEYSAFLRMLSMPIHSAVVVPKNYFKASNELVVVNLLVCWTITLVFRPEQAFNHPARGMVGHFNPCFGWDFPPASYVAIVISAADVYLAWTYAVLEAQRTCLLDTDGKTTWAEHFALKTAYLHGFASMIWMLLWDVGPPDGRWLMHLAIF